MKLLRYGSAGQEKPGLLDSSNIIRDLSSVVPDIAGATLTPEGLARIKAIDPGSGPRNSSLKTKIGKNELAATANCSVVGLSGTETNPFKRLTSRSIVTLPLSTIIL
mgnify:CR=1 FL=1